MKKITDYAELVKAKHALNKTIAPVEDGASMAGSYTSGKQFIRDSVLYSALTSIAAGTAWSSLTLDTDYEVADDVSTQIAAVNQTLSNTNTALGNEVATRATLGAHNLLLPKWGYSSINGLTFAINSDKSVTVSGTPEDNTTNGMSSSFKLKKGTYIFSCGVFDNDMGFGINDVSNNRIATLLYNDVGGKIFTLSQDTVVYAFFFCSSGISFATPKTFYPMIRLATDASSDYEPYSMTNQEIAELLPHKTGSIVASEAVTVNSSHVLRFGQVISVHVDFTVGNTAIPAWDTSFLKIPSDILPEGITGTMQNASTVIQSVLDFTNDVAKIGYVTLAMGSTGADKGFFSNRSFAANIRYNIGMVFIVPPTM